jgi:hypothetical protein
MYIYCVFRYRYMSMYTYVDIYELIHVYIPGLEAGGVSEGEPNLDEFLDGYLDDCLKYLKYMNICIHQ